MEKYTVTTISQFLNTISDIKAKYNLDELWFRGVENTNYKLTPSLYRGMHKLDKPGEQEIYFDFIRKVKAFIHDYNKFRPIDWYIIMQHYGFPTRLLDWTSGSLTALFFATRNSRIDNDRCVYIIDPFDLNKAFHNKEEVFCPEEFFFKDNQIIDQYLPFADLPEYPIAIEPPYIDKRVVAQKSCFTIHGKNRESFETLCDEKKIRLIKIEINDAYSLSIKEELASAGITESIVFPDLEGLARELIFEHVIE